MFKTFEYFLKKTETLFFSVIAFLRILSEASGIFVSHLYKPHLPYFNDWYIFSSIIYTVENIQILTIEAGRLPFSLSGSKP